MTDPRDDQTPDLPDDDLLAAEHVLGVHDAATRRALTARMETDGAFAARVRDWEGRLSGLNAGYPPLPAPDLLPAIEARLFPAPAVTPAASRAGIWRWLTGAGAGLAAVAMLLVAVTLWQATPPPTPVPAPAVLAADLSADTLVFAARYDGAVLEVARSGDAAGPGADYQLWLIDDSGVPRSLGLLRDPVVRLSADLAAGLTLAVSLEPFGGSPEPVPTGPVLAAAVLTVL